jgi:hypothetical protein
MLSLGGQDRLRSFGHPSDGAQDDRRFCCVLRQGHTWFCCVLRLERVALLGVEAGTQVVLLCLEAGTRGFVGC